MMGLLDYGLIGKVAVVPGGRGDEITDLDQTITAEQAEQAREVMTHVVEEYFS